LFTLYLKLIKFCFNKEDGTLKIPYFSQKNTELVLFISQFSLGRYMLRTDVSNERGRAKKNNAEKEPSEKARKVHSSGYDPFRTTTVPFYNYYGGRVLALGLIFD